MVWHFVVLLCTLVSKKHTQHNKKQNKHTQNTTKNKKTKESKKGKGKGEAVFPLWFKAVGGNRPGNASQTDRGSGYSPKMNNKLNKDCKKGYSKGK